MSVVFNTTTNNTNIITVPFVGAATQTFTLMCWAFLNGTTPANYRDIMTIDPNIFMQVFSDGISIDFGTANDDHVGQVLLANTWYHFTQVVVPTSTTARQIYGYVNGQLNVNVADTDTSLVTTNICIGSSVLSLEAFPLNGNIQDAKVWTRVLTPTEIVDEMRSSVPVHRQALLLYAPFEDNKTADKSGNNNVLTVGSAVTIGPGISKSFSKYKRSLV